MDFTNSEVGFILTQIEEIKKIKSLPYLDFVFKLIDIKNIFKQKYEILKEKAETLNKERTELILKYCTKDKQGKVIVENGGYLGLERGVNSDYDSASDKITEGVRSINKGICELSVDEKTRLQKCIIDNNIFENKTIKEEFTGDMYEAIAYFIKE